MYALRRNGPLGRADLALLLSFVIAGAAATSAAAQSRLGATDGRGPLGDGSVSAGEADAALQERVEMTAARLLAVARQDLAEGRPDVAQRLIELLIARYPESRVAADARRQLYSLYAMDKNVGAASPPHGRSHVTSPDLPGPNLPGSTTSAKPPSAPHATGQSAPTALRPAVQVPPPPTTHRAPPYSPAPSADTAQPSGTGWRTSMIGYRRLQDELRNGVGDRIFFSVGSAELGSRARAVIVAQAEWLQQRPEVEVTVEGHADDAMAGADDEKLAVSRAAAVRDRLVAEGVQAERIRLSPQGARDPVAVCGDSDCAAQNRRAIVQVAVRRAQPGNNLAPAAAPMGRPGDQRR